MQKFPCEFGVENNVVVSMTTLPARIHSVVKVVDTIMNQTVKVDKIVLCLGEDSFPNKESDLPNEFTGLKRRGLEILWCKDLGPHTKYFYTMQKYKQNIVITVDDDIYYPKDLVEKLLKSYIKYPYAISARRAHLIEFDEAGRIMPYNNWKNNYFAYTKPSLSLLATGVGGVLYPPFSMSDELFNEKMIRSTCLKQDDLWLKIIQVLTSTPVVVCDYCKLDCVENTQESGLWNTNVTQSKNDVQLNAILCAFKDVYGDKILNRIYESYKFLGLQLDDCYDESYNIMRQGYEHQICDLTERLRKKTLSYKIKRFFQKFI